MINLIPKEAKKQIVKEYWMRSVTVWCFLWACALLLGMSMLIPSYVLINLQVDAYTASAEQASLNNANLELIAAELEEANTIAVILQDNFSRPTMAEYIALVRSLETSDITTEKLNLSRDGAHIRTILVSGTARDRQSLASFRSRLLETGQIEQVDLPISNLAKDREIPFELTVQVATSTDP